MDQVMSLFMRMLCNSVPIRRRHFLSVELARLIGIGVLYVFFPNYLSYCAPNNASMKLSAFIILPMLSAGYQAGMVGKGDCSTILQINFEGGCSSCKGDN